MESKKSHSARPAHPTHSSRTPHTRHLRRFLTIVFYLLFAAGALIIPQFVVYFPMSWLLGSALSHPFWSSLYSVLSYGLALALLVLVLKYKKRQDPRHTLGLQNLPKWSDLALAPIGFIAYTALASLALQLFTLFPTFDAAEPQSLGGLDHLYFTGDRIFAFITLAIVAPVVEELIFRGWLYAKLRAKLPAKFNLPLSILLTSLLFALLHGQLNVGINVFCLSLILCALREVTGTIHAGILLHILKNSLAFLLRYLL